MQTWWPNDCCKPRPIGLRSVETAAALVCPCLCLLLFCQFDMRHASCERVTCDQEAVKANSRGPETANPAHDRRNSQTSSHARGLLDPPAEQVSSTSSGSLLRQNSAQKSPLQLKQTTFVLSAGKEQSCLHRRSGLRTHHDKNWNSSACCMVSSINLLRE